MDLTNCPPSHHHNDPAFVAVWEGVSSPSRPVRVSSPSQPWTVRVTVVTGPRGDQSQTQVTTAATVLTTNMTSTSSKTNINRKVGPHHTHVEMRLKEMGDKELFAVRNKNIVLNDTTWRDVST